MATRAQEQVFEYVAWDTSANSYVTGDVANHTIMWLKNGVATTAAGTPAEVNSSFCPGTYRVTASPTETDCFVGAIAGKSTTSKVAIFGPTIAFEYIPAVSAGATGGLPILDASNSIRAVVASVSAGAMAAVSISSVTGAVGSVTAGVLVGSVSAGAMAAVSISSVTGAVGSVTTPVTIGAVSAGAMSAVTISSVTGSVGSVTGAVGSVTGSVGSVVAGVIVGSVSAGAMAGVSISSVTGSVGSVTAGVIVGSVSAGAISTASFAAAARVPSNIFQVNSVNVPASAGYMAVDWGTVVNQTATVGLTNTTISTTQTVSAVTGPVTVGAINGTASNIKKNQALAGFQFIMTDSTTHAPKTGVTVTAVRSINGGAFAACANSATEISNGWYTIDLAASDLNGNTIALRFTGASSDDRDILIVTQL